MTNREKQIEKIQNLLPDVEVIMATRGYIDFPRYLYDHNCRIIPEGAVVLTGTKDFERIEDLLTEFDEMGFLPTTTCPYPNAYASNWKLRLAWAIGELRKEMAREILKLTKEKCKELEDKYSHYCKSKKECLEETCRYEGVLAVKRELYELAKRYGVDLEE